MIYIQNNAVNQLWLGINEWSSLTNPTYLFKLQNSQGKDTHYFIPKNITSSVANSYANKYLVFEFSTYQGNPQSFVASGSTDCNIHLFNENQYWLSIWEQNQGDYNLNPAASYNKVFNELAFIFKFENSTYYTGNTSLTADNVIYYNPAITPPASPSPTPSITPSTTPPLPSPSITPSITPTITNTPTITSTPTLTPTPSATPDFRFQLGSGFDGVVQSINVDIQGDLFVFGQFNFYKNLGKAKIVNIDNNGNPLGGFASGFPGIPNDSTISIYDSAVDSVNSEMYVVGSFPSTNVDNYYSGVASPHQVQINSQTGELINAGDFALLNANVSVYSVALDSTDVYYGGAFTSIKGTTQNRITKISKTGVIDTTFRTNMGTGANQIVWKVLVASDGGIVLGGQFTSFNGNARQGICKLNANGTFDSTFISPFGNTLVYDMKELSDGRIVCVGSFTNPKQRVAILNSGGTIDNSFTPSTDLGSQGAYAVAVDEAGGWIYVLGNATNIGGIDGINYLCRFDFSGNLDTTYPAQEFSAPLANPQTLGAKPLFGQYESGQFKLYVGGGFTSFGTQQYNRFIKLNADGTSDTRTDI